MIKKCPKSLTFSVKKTVLLGAPMRLIEKLKVDFFECG